MDRQTDTRRQLIPALASVVRVMILQTIQLKDCRAGLSRRLSKSTSSCSSWLRRRDPDPNGFYQRMASLIFRPQQQVLAVELNKDADAL